MIRENQRGKLSTYVNESLTCITHSPREDKPEILGYPPAAAAPARRSRICGRSSACFARPRETTPPNGPSRRCTTCRPSRWPLRRRFSPTPSTPRGTTPRKSRASSPAHRPRSAERRGAGHRPDAPAPVHLQRHAAVRDGQRRPFFCSVIGASDPRGARRCTHVQSRSITCTHDFNFRATLWRCP